MLQGLRWQIAALLLALILFSVALTARLSSNDVSATAEASATPAPTATVPPTETPLAAETGAAEPTVSAPSVVTFREGVLGEIQRINPLYANLNPVDRDLTSLIFEGLTRINIYGEPEPNLAQSWVVSSDGLEYVVRLREDALWHDGTPFTADDVVYTMEILRSPDFSGAEELGVFWRTVETHRLDTYLIRFRLTQPLGSFIEKLSIGLLPQHVLQGTRAAQLAAHPFNLSPIGTGPYQLEALRSRDNSQIESADLRVAPVYRLRPEGREGFAIDRMRFVFYESFDALLDAVRAGEIDGLFAASREERNPLLAAAGERYDHHTTVQPVMGTIIFNWQNEQKPFFREQRVRLALEIGLDRDPIIERWMRNTAVEAGSPLIGHTWAYMADLEWPPFDPIGARLLLETANLRLPADEEEADEEASTLFGFTILTPDDAVLTSISSEVAAQWSQLNVDVGVDAVDDSAYLARLESGDFDAALVELALGENADPDLYTFWHQGQYPDGKNYGGMDDRRISEVLELARRDYSGINRAIHYANFQRDFIERAVAIPMYYPLYTYVTSAHFRDIQLGFTGTPSDRFKTIKDWKPAA